MEKCRLLLRRQRRHGSELHAVNLRRQERFSCHRAYTVPTFPAHVSHVISFTRLGLCCEVARVRSKRKIQACGVTLHNPTPHSSNQERRFDMIRYDSWYIHAPCEPMSSCQSRSDKEHIALFQGRTAKLQTQLSVQIKSSKCVVWNGTPEMSRHHPGFGHLHSHRT